MSLDRFIWFPFYTNDFLSSGTVRGMNNEERGAYVMLLCQAWMEEEPGVLPNDDTLLQRWSGCMSEDEWRRVSKRVLAAFRLSSRDGRSVLVSKRLRNEGAKAQHNKEVASKRGRKAAAARWGKS